VNEKGLAAEKRKEGSTLATSRANAT